MKLRSASRMWRYLVLIGCIGLSFSVDAAPVRNKFHVISWSGGAYFDDHNKTFERCAATKPSPDATDVSFAVDRDLHWKVTLSNPAWNFAKGAKLTVNVAIDDIPVLTDASVVAIDRSMLELQTADAVSFFAKLRIAQKLRVVIGGRVLDISLEGGEEALSALTQCVLRSARVYQSAKSNESIFSAQTSSKANHTEAAALVSNIDAYSRVPEMQVTPGTTDLSGLPVDAAWKIGLISAAVTIVEAPLPKERIAEDIIRRSLQSCHGGFFFVSSGDVISNTPIARVFVSCETLETTISSYHTVVPRSQAGNYIFSVLSTGSAFLGAPHRLADLYEARLRSVVMVAINKLQ